MRNKITLLFLLLNTSIFAQWMPLNSGTAANLYDVDFLDADYGIAGGDSGIVLLTSDGGNLWTPVNVGAGNTDRVGAVEMVSTDTFIVSYVDANNIPHVVYTYNAGIFWQPLFDDSSCFRPMDTETGNGKWISVGSSLVSTSNGTSWDTLMEFTCGTNDIARLERTGITYNGGGLQSGFATYSASMIRSADGGNNFYPYDPFSFPNSDALTAFDFPASDTGYIFMNKYAGFMPGTRNSVVQLTNFVLAVPVANDSIFTFTSTVLDTTLPAYINDGKFTGQHGYAAGDDGVIYESTTGGTSWTAAYTNTGSVNRFSFPDDETGYAVGDSGTILKLTTTTGMKKIANRPFKVYPNPARTQIFVPFSTNEKYTIADVNGAIVLRGETENGLINIASLSEGSYTLIIQTAGGLKHSRFIRTE